MAGRPQRRARLFAEIQARTGGDIPDTWGLPAAELSAEHAAVRLLLEHHGDVQTALHAFAPATARIPEAQQRRRATRYFGDSNRFMAALRRKIERDKDQLLGALFFGAPLQAATNFGRPDMALRAIDTLARIAG